MAAPLKMGDGFEIQQAVPKSFPLEIEHSMRQSAVGNFFNVQIAGVVLLANGWTWKPIWKAASIDLVPTRKSSINLRIYGCPFEGDSESLTEHLSACSYGQVSGYLERTDSRLQGMVAVLHQDEERRTSLRKSVTQMEDRFNSLGQDIQTSSRRLSERLELLSSNLETTQAQIGELMAALNPQQRRRSGPFKQVVAPVAPAEIPEGGLRCTGTFSGHRGPVWCLAVSREHGVMVSGSSDLNLKIWDLASSKCKATLQGHVGIVYVLQLMGNRIFSGSADKSIKVWDLVSYRELKTLDTQENTVCALAIGGGYLFSGSYRAIRVWDITTYEFVRKLEGHEHWVRGMVVNQGCLWTGAYNTVKRWPMDSFETDRSFSDQEGSLYAVAVTAEYVIGASFYRRSTDVISRGSYENVIKVWSLRTGIEVACLGGHLGPIYALQVEGNRLFSGSFDSTIKVWSLKSFTCIQTLLRHTGSVEALFCHGQSLFSGSGDGTIKIWTP
jgi:E3 ubiquitin-protein ligase TRAF7